MYQSTRGVFHIANTLRACFDLMIDNNFAVIRGMHEDFICNEKYTNIVFEKAKSLVGLSNWADIDVFLGKEYMLSWLRYKEEFKDVFRLA